MITFIVPARGGSQRLPNKNIKKLNGKPLIFYTIEALLNHVLISNIVFTSDSKEYCDLVEKEFGDKVIIEVRPEETASNTTKVVDEIERLLRFRSELFKTEWFGLALPTAPLRNHQTHSDSWDPRDRMSPLSLPLVIQLMFGQQTGLLDMHLEALRRARPVYHLYDLDCIYFFLRGVLATLLLTHQRREQKLLSLLLLRISCLLKQSVQHHFQLKCLHICLQDQQAYYSMLRA